jgi:hypothetical protein
MEWKAISEGLPAGAALIFAEGEYHVAVVVDGESDPAFMGVHSWDLLPWPSHWMELPPAPSAEPLPD